MTRRCMTKIRTTRARAVTIMLAYLMLILGAPMMEERCCADHHHDDDQAASTSGFISFGEADHHRPHECSHHHGILALQATAKNCLQAVGCCTGHKHDCSAANNAKRAVQACFSSSPKTPRSFLCTTPISGSVVMMRGNPLSPHDALPVVPTAISLQTIVLLI